MTNIPELVNANQKRWVNAKITRGPEFAVTAKRLLADKTRFQLLAARCGVPWFVIAVIKEREAGPDPKWNLSIAQGDPWRSVSVHAPEGRGPFKSWEDAALDALIKCAPHAAQWKDWSPGGTMTLLEQYNGLAYANHGVPSPYIWSGTDQYIRGKVLVDHGPIEPVVDKQLGCAGLILAMQALDPSIAFGGAPKLVPPPPIASPPQPIGWLAMLLSFFTRKG